MDEPPFLARPLPLAMDEVPFLAKPPLSMPDSISSALTPIGLAVDLAFGLAIGLATSPVSAVNGIVLIEVEKTPYSYRGKGGMYKKLLRLYLQSAGLVATTKSRARVQKANFMLMVADLRV